jgi:hypothetical protein
VREAKKMASDPFPFLRLPLELREQVYSLYFKPADRLDVLEADYGGGVYRFDLNVYRVNRQIKTEAEDVFRRQNAFIRIETPWPQAGTSLPGCSIDLYRGHCMQALDASAD